MASQVESSDKTEIYRHHVRNHFIDHVKDPQLQQKFREFSRPGPHLKEDICKKQQNNADLGANCVRQKNFNLTMSGGDAGRTLNHSFYDCNTLDNYCRTNMKQFPAVSDANVCTSRKYQKTAVENCMGDHNYCFENDSTFGWNKSEDSAKSQKSLKTVVSRKSSHDLRKLITSQCKLHEDIREVLKDVDVTEVENTNQNNECGMQRDPSNVYPLSLSQCKRCSEHLNTTPSQKDVLTEVRNNDLLHCTNTNTLTISVDDVINSRVINPMIHKLHRMYLNNLKEEMSLMEDLERLPNKVNEVYKSILLQQKE